MIGRDVIIGQNVMAGPNVRIGDGCKIQNNVVALRGRRAGGRRYSAGRAACSPMWSIRAPRSAARPSSARPWFAGAPPSAPTRRSSAASPSANYAIIGAGAVVTRNVPGHALMVGTPARRTGWISRAGEKLGSDLVCPRTGERYRLNGPESPYTRRIAPARRLQKERD